MSASKPQNETPFRHKSDKLTRPFKMDVLRNHIHAKMTSGNFRLHPSQSDPDLEKFFGARGEHDLDSTESVSWYCQAILFPSYDI